MRAQARTCVGRFTAALVFGRIAGYEDVNGAERLRHDAAMRLIMGGKVAQGHAASSSQMRRFETLWLAAPASLSALSDLSGQWIDLVHGRRAPRGIVLDMDSSVCPTHDEQENSVKLSGKEEALLVVTACSKPPKGRARRTLELLAGGLVGSPHIRPVSP